MGDDTFICRGCKNEFPWMASGDEKKHLTLCHPCYQKQGWCRRGTAKVSKAACHICPKCNQLVFIKRHSPFVCKAYVAKIVKASGGGVVNG
jgi:hypothetical protein